MDVHQSSDLLYVGTIIHGVIIEDHVSNGQMVQLIKVYTNKGNITILILSKGKTGETNSLQFIENENPS